MDAFDDKCEHCGALCNNDKCECGDDCMDMDAVQEDAANLVMEMRGEITRLRAEVEQLTRERDEAVGRLQEVLGGECEIAGRWCLTHRTNDCAVPEAREFLARVKP